MMEKKSKDKVSKSSLEFYRSKEHSDGFIAEYNVVKMPKKNNKNNNKIKGNFKTK